MNKIVLDLQIACKNNHNLPKKNHFQAWLNAFVPRFRKQSEITIRLVDEQEMHELNLLFCKKNKITNVLSFLFSPPPGIKTSLLGDIIICQQAVKKEAKKYKKLLEAHWAHMVIHGSLHLLGYDHHTDHDAKKMECLEIEIMHSFGYDNPYSSSE